MRSDLDFLQECFRALNRLRGRTSPTSIVSPALGVKHDTLNLRAITTEDFAAAVRERPLTNQVQESLLSLYERALQRLKTIFSQHFSEAQSRWGASRPHALPMLHTLFEAECDVAARDTQETILSLVDERLDLYVNDASANQYTNTRPHSQKAVRVLETAFQHAPNITQAEKYKLAEATGLQPRQVTIWVRCAYSPVPKPPEPTCGPAAAAACGTSPSDHRAGAAYAAPCATLAYKART